MYHFIAVNYYFGIVMLPFKEYYCSIKKCMPRHDIVNELGMTKGRFGFLWSHFDVQGVNDEKGEYFSEQ